MLLLNKQVSMAITRNMVTTMMLKVVTATSRRKANATTTMTTVVEANMTMRMATRMMATLSNDEVISMMGIFILRNV